MTVEKTDVEIAQSSVLRPITEIASSIGIEENDLELYGKYKAKITEQAFRKVKDREDAKLILVTAINPTKAGEGKTTVSIGLADAFRKLGKKSIVALREPSLGPCFGMKGGAAGGGYAQVVPMEDINLHFTGDFHAITTAHNLLAALIDNHIQQGNTLKIDSRRILWKRVLDVNDRVLRKIVVGLGGKANGMPRETGFDITVASELMAILCLAENLEDMKRRIGQIAIAYDVDGRLVKAAELKSTGAIALLFKDAIKPNIVQTLEGTPAFIHGGPFANIAHGCNSIIATKFALKFADYVVTEAGFGADLGAEKFLDIKCPLAKCSPAIVVIVASVRALKMHGGFSQHKNTLSDMDMLAIGMENLKKHIENMNKFSLPTIVALNIFNSDKEEELAFIEEQCEIIGTSVVRTEVWEKGGEGGLLLAQKIEDITLNTEKKSFKPLYDIKDKIKVKIETIAREIYGASGVEFTPLALKTISELETMGLDKMPICMAKTQYSLSDDEKKYGRPKDFIIHVREIRVLNGAGFIVALTGNILTMPGLPKHPAAEMMDIDASGRITGLF